MFFFLASAFITSSTGDIIADNGATVTLEVTAEGTPNDITYEWRKDGVVIPNEVSNTLIIDQISVNDIGEYECIPINAAGSFNSSIIQVDVEGMCYDQCTVHVNICIMTDTCTCTLYIL